MRGRYFKFSGNVQNCSMCIQGHALGALGTNGLKMKSSLQTNFNSYLKI